MLWNIFVWALAVISVQAPERMVDLTGRVDNETRTAGQSTGRDQVDCRGRGTGRVGPAPTLSLTVARLDKSEYSMGGQFVADVRLTNTGTEPVMLPSALPHEFGDGFAGGPYAVQASLGISGVDAEGREHHLSGTILRGSPSRPGTIESLDPGESLIIRFPGWIVNVDGPSAPTTGDAQLFATLILTDNECRDWKAVNSRRVNTRLRGRD